jgi:hypothetical protein
VILRLADGLSLPVEAATETFLVVGKRGSGKSSTATRLAEQLIRSKVPIAVLDPVDVWWGLKAGADGTREGGLEVYVFGGEHAELPLEPTAGVLMADTLVDHRINAVFVLRQFSNREKARFVSDFAEQLFKRNRDVLHLFCEEAHEVMPQNPYGGEEEMLGRMIRLVKLGRTSGIGVSAITQRPASLNKNATTQCEVLVAHRILGAQDRDAVDDWIKYHRLQEQRAEFLASLGELKTGEAWVWAPDFPEAKPIGLRRVQVTMPETFDSRRTPKPGEHRKEPKSLAPVDLEKLGERMAATRKRAEENDPAKMRVEIATLKKQLAAAANQGKTPQKAQVQRVEVPVLKDAQIKRLEKAAERLENAGTAYAGLVNITSEIGYAIKAALSAASSTASASPVRTVEGAAVRAAARASLYGAGSPEQGVGTSVGVHTDRPTKVGVLRIAVPSAASRTTSSLGKGERAILSAIAQHFETGVTRDQLSVLTGYRRSTRDTYVQRLREAGLVDQNGGGTIRVSDQGIATLGDGYAPLPTGDALREHWLNRLRGGELALFGVLVEAYPNSVHREALSEKTKYARSSRDTYLQRLVARKLVRRVGRGEVRAAEELFV